MFIGGCIVKEGDYLYEAGYGSLFADPCLLLPGSVVSCCVLKPLNHDIVVSKTSEITSQKSSEQ